MIARIFFVVNRSWSGFITLSELRRSNLLGTLRVSTKLRSNKLATKKDVYCLYCHGNLLKGVDKKNVRREGIEPTKRVFNYVLCSHFSHFLWENQMIQNRNFLHGRNFFVKVFFFVLCTTDWTALTQVTIPLSNLPWFILSKDFILIIDK